MTNKKDYVKSFKCTETFMGKNNIMMERDVYELIPAEFVDMPNRYQYVTIAYGDPKPIGKIFTGQNRKERRKIESTNRKQK